jgi:hypothetical protein
MRLLLKQRALFVVLMLALLPPAASKPVNKFFLLATFVAVKS